MVERLFLAVPWGCLCFVIVVFPDHTHLLFSGLVEINCHVVFDVFSLVNNSNFQIRLTLNMLTCVFKGSN